jgi:hypothetical protein
MGAPIVRGGTGMQLCNKCEEILPVYDIPLDPISTDVFDTTASNMGIHEGCYTRLDQRLGQPYSGMPAGTTWQTSISSTQVLNISTYALPLLGPVEPMFKWFQAWYIP